MLAVATQQATQLNGGAICSHPFFFYLFFLFYLCYNAVMEYATIVISSFWEIMEQFAVVATPVIAIILVMRIVRSVLFNVGRF